jgi:hypothetical protein
MMKYCVKNYFIKNANQVPNGDFYPKFMYESAKNENTKIGWRYGNDDEISVTINGHRYKVK